MRQSKGRIWAGLLAVAFIVTGCDLFAPGAPATRPAPRSAPQADAVPEPSAESQSYARYYATVQQRLIANGLLRTDGGGPDTPITNRNLVANFERIALFDEYALTNGRFVQQQTPSRLRRWRGPVRLQAHFGASVPAEERDRDRSILGTYATRLARVTGHPIRQVTGGGNFHVLYLNRDEQRDAGPLLRRLLPSIGEETVQEITSLPRFTFCSVYAFSATGATPNYVTAIAIIRTEHPDLLRRSCVHEEVAQGLGLPNDSPVARPSIFNDDEEFALLTRHDELLLEILYDPRLRPGMEPAEARPVVQVIASELLGGSS
ncbi:DUF2927 domain-containing protein [Rhodophyticola sp. CCM32]|uniref:DUF2927 domain-containing protein n=1 Tax=Rhodophyticola sp. CCM32 TaxID=2916397 RepID=UPI00107F695F|nr:DUF2927 domain-containing protein [Rhodophyticola sp. CCM32]QBX99733.1 DUF2927 domain-containing protein [Rhodophyticola sp. CCM32]